MDTIALRFNICGSILFRSELEWLFGAALWFDTGLVIGSTYDDRTLLFFVPLSAIAASAEAVVVVAVVISRIAVVVEVDVPSVSISSPFTPVTLESWKVTTLLGDTAR